MWNILFGMFCVHKTIVALKFDFSNVSKMENADAESAKILHEEIKALANEIQSLKDRKENEDLVLIK